MLLLSITVQPRSAFDPTRVYWLFLARGFQREKLGKTIDCNFARSVHTYTLYGIQEEAIFSYIIAVTVFRVDECSTCADGHTFFEDQNEHCALIYLTNMK